MCRNPRRVKNSDDSVENVDTTMPYRFSIKEMEKTANVDPPSKRKKIVPTTNILCGLAADEKVSVDVSNLGETVGVGADASLIELLVKDNLPSMVKNRPTMLYTVRVVPEMCERSTGTPKSNTEVPALGKLTNAANLQK